jgi:mono/diheme cytochrome c family protein
MSALPPNSDPRLEPAGASDASIQRVHAGILREKPEPAEPGGYSLTPLLLLGLVSGLILFGSVFLVQNRGGFDSLVYNGHLDPTVVVSVEPTLEEIIAKGKSIYGQSCIQCHGPAGLGAPGAFPPLAGSEWVNGPEERIIRIVLHGLSGTVHVGGAELVLPNKMPSLIAPPFNFNDAKISYVLTYVRQDFGNKAPPVTIEKVAAVRAQTAAHSAEFTETELLAVPAAP